MLFINSFFNLNLILYHSLNFSFFFYYEFQFFFIIHIKNKSIILKSNLEYAVQLFSAFSLVRMVYPSFDESA